MNAVFLILAVSLLVFVVLGVLCVLFIAFADELPEAQRWTLRFFGVAATIFLLICMIGTL